MIFLVIVPCILCFVYAWRRRQKYLEGKLPPASDGAWPVVGHFHLWISGLFWTRLLGIQKDCLAKDCVTYLYSGTNSTYTYYALCDPKDCNKIANESQQKVFILEDSIKVFFGDGLATVSSVSVWEERRRLLEPAFNRMCNLAVTNQRAKELAVTLNDKLGKGYFDQTEYLRPAVMCILFSTIFGVGGDNHFRNENIKKYQQIMQKVVAVLFERSQSYFMHKKLFFNLSRLKRKQDECTRAIQNMSREVITMRRAELSQSKVEDVSNGAKATSPECLLDALLSLEAQGLYTEQQVIDEVNTTMFSSYETLVNTLTFALVMLGSHPAVQDKVCLEIENYMILENSNDATATEDMDKLVYMEAVIMETLRLHPTVPTISRIIDSQIEIKKYSIDKGAQCLLFIYAMNRHPSWGPDREVFRPERWLDNPNPGCAALGLGRRSCIGKKMALNTMKIILVHILREYTIVADKTKMTATHKIFLTPLSGHHITLQRKPNNP